MTDVPDRSCAACAHFVVDFAHPLHANLCNRLGGRLLSADYERSLPAPSCGPEGRDFAAKAAPTSAKAEATLA